MNDFEKRKRQLLQPLLVEAGAALMDCQGFEYGLALLLLHFGRLGTEGLPPETLFLILDDKEKKTAGQLILMLRRHLTISDGLDEALTNALTARNKLIHRVLVDNIERVVDADSRALLVKEIRRLRSQVQKASKMLQPFIVALSEALDGVNQKQLEKELKERFA